MFDLQVPENRNISPECVTLSNRILDSMNLVIGEYQTSDTIYASKTFLRENFDEINSILAKHVVKNLFEQLEVPGFETGLESRRALLAFLRRLVYFFEGAVVKKRVQYTNASGKNTCTYQYKVLF